ncbi:MAG: hypothetical protein KGY81_01680 [Phycisphaerae bacterium]|jgi:hypothetical protein|nr:hypothetical protein [Phycisphaerae bacterium]
MECPKCGTPDPWDNSEQLQEDMDYAQANYDYYGGGGGGPTHVDPADYQTEYTCRNCNHKWK